MVSIGAISRPSASVGTDSIVRPWSGSSPTVVRTTVSTRLLKCACEHHVLCPLITKPSPERSALQATRATSEPAFGSDIEIASHDPRATSPSTSCFCSGVPKRSYAPATITVVP
jgi:hypothetical protein